MESFSTSLFNEQDETRQIENKKNVDSRKLCRFYFLIAVFIAVVLIFSLCAAYYASNQEGLLNKTILRTELDNRNYKAIILSNSLKVLLISDPEIESSAVGMNINVGSFNDPVEIPGISHLLEHMLMKGSKKYPNSLEFANYLEENQGEKNEITGSENTVFYFTIENNKLQNALEIFSRYFLEPVFNKESFQGELDQIEQEYEQIINKNEYKSQFLLKIMASSQHPFSKFNIGNMDSLKKGPEKQGLNSYWEMIDFHQSHYSANLMNLVIIAKNSIEVLEEWAKNKFSLVKNNLIEKSNWKTSPRPYGFDQLGIIAKIQGKTMENKLFLVFPLQEQLTKFKEKPLDYLDFIIKYPGKEALLSTLKRKGLVFTLKTIIYEDTSDFTLYGVEMSLTMTGFQNIPLILDIFFSYIQEIEKKGIHEETYQDLSKISKILFRFSEPRPLTTEIRELTKNLGEFPIHNVISGSQIYLNFDQNLIRQTVRSMTVKNCIAIVESPKFVYKDNNDTTKNSKNQKTDINGKKIDNDTFRSINNTSETNIVGNNGTMRNSSFLENADEIINKTASIFFLNSNNSKIFNNRNSLRFKEAFENNRNNVFLKIRDTVNESYFLKTDLSGYSDLYDLSFAFQKMDQNLISRFLNPKSQGFSLPKQNFYIPEKFSMIPQCQISDLIPIKPQYLFSKNRTHNNLTVFSNDTLEVLVETTQDTFSNKTESNSTIAFHKLSCSIGDISNDLAQDHPDLLITSKDLILWHKLDRSFKLPKIEAWISWENPYVWLSAKDYQMTCFLIRFYAEIFNEQMPEIRMNGNSIELSATFKGLLLKFSGFSDKADQIFKSLFGLFRSNTITEDIYQNIQEEVIRDYYFDLMDFQPLKEMKISLQKVLKKTFYTTENLLEIAPSISFQEIESFDLKFASTGRLKALLMGNLLNETAVGIMKTGFETLNLTGLSGQDETFSEKILNVSRKALFFHKQTNASKGDLDYLLNYYQYGIKDIGNLTKLFLIINGLDAYCSSLMKIDTSMDENAEVSLFHESGIYGITIFLAKINKNSRDLDRIIENFLQNYEEVLKKYTNEDFEKLKGLILAVLKENDKNLQEKSERYWNEIFTDFLDFDQKNRMRRLIEIMNLSDVLEFYKYFFKQMCGKISISLGNKVKSGELLAKNESYVNLEEKKYDLDGDFEGIGRFETQIQSKLS